MCQNISEHIAQRLEHDDFDLHRTSEERLGRGRRVERYGVVRGVHCKLRGRQRESLLRIEHCHPHSGGGLDVNRRSGAPRIQTIRQRESDRRCQ